MENCIVREELIIMFSKYGARDLLLMCRSKWEVNQMRDYVSKHPNGDILANNYFHTLSADCLRYIEALEKAGIHANNIEQLAMKEGEVKMSNDEMRKQVNAAYNNGQKWLAKTKKMDDGQIQAVYFRLKLKGVIK